MATVRLGMRGTATCLLEGRRPWPTRTTDRANRLRVKIGDPTAATPIGTAYWGLSRTMRLLGFEDPREVIDHGTGLAQLGITDLTADSVRPDALGVLN